MPAAGEPSSGGGSELSMAETLQQMYRISADYERDYEQKVQELLRVGRRYLDVEIGFLTEIVEDTQHVVAASGEHDRLAAGESCPLSKAYCRKTIDQEEAVTVQHAAIEGWEHDSAYDEFGFEAYIGAKVVVGGEVEGTFCFADSQPREQPFAPEEETVVELMAEWVGYERFQQQATERLQRQRDRLETFTRMVSHDLRNPLAVARGYLAEAERTGDVTQLEECRAALDRMDTLIEDLLMLAQAGEQIGDLKPVDLTAVIDECWSVVATDEATIRVESEAVVRADRSRLRQVFENLFRNAIEHAAGDVTVQVGELADGRGFYVADDGPGIAGGDHEQVFEEGYSTAAAGSGYGLSIVEEIVEAHGWAIRVTDSAEGGARFEITGVEFDDG